MNESLLLATDLKTGYGLLEVIHGVSLFVNKNEIVSIIGANGAGKTTLMGILSGTLPCRSGSVFFQSNDITNLSAHERVPRGLALVPEGRKIFSKLTVEENLEIGAFTVRDKIAIRSRVEEAYTLFPILAERRTQLGGTLSGGEQQMLALARALMSAPSLLLLDEPSMGVAPLIVEKIFQTLVELQKRGMSILLVEQNAEVALTVSSRSYVLEVGAVAFEGKSADIAKDPRVQQAYLGV